MEEGINVLGKKLQLLEGVPQTRRGKDGGGREGGGSEDGG